jgi:hypothetical protein
MKNKWRIKWKRGLEERGGEENGVMDQNEEKKERRNGDVEKECNFNFLLSTRPPRVWGRGEPYTGFWWGNLRERDHLRDPGVNGRIILRWIFRKWDFGVWTGSSWLRIGAGGGHL